MIELILVVATVIYDRSISPKKVDLNDVVYGVEMSYCASHQLESQPQTDCSTVYQTSIRNIIILVIIRYYYVIINFKWNFHCSPNIIVSLQAMRASTSIYDE